MVHAPVGNMYNFISMSCVAMPNTLNKLCCASRHSNSCSSAEMQSQYLSVYVLYIITVHTVTSVALPCVLLNLGLFDLVFFLKSFLPDSFSLLLVVLYGSEAPSCKGLLLSYCFCSPPLYLHLSSC